MREIRMSGSEGGGAGINRLFLPLSPYSEAMLVEPIQGYLPSRLVGDPSGYFVIYVDRARGILSLEHYRNDGLLDTIIEGRTAAELYTPAIDRRLLSRSGACGLPWMGTGASRGQPAFRGTFSWRMAPHRKQALSPVLTDITCGPACWESET